MVHFPQWKAVLVLLACLAGVLLAIPNLIPRATLDSLPSWLPKHQVSLGLDLRGGSHLLLEKLRRHGRKERIALVIHAMVVNNPATSFHPSL